MPASLKGGPFTTNSVPLTRYNIFSFLILWLSLVPIIFMIAYNIKNTWFDNPLYFYVVFPLYFLGYYLLTVIFALFWGWIFLKISILFHRPYEGVFKRDLKDINYRYWIIRANIKRVPLWLAHNTPFPWIDILAFKMYGCTVPISTSLFDAWVDTEFLEIGSNSIIGQGAIIMTSMFTKEHLIIKRVRIGSRCLVGSHSVIMPGTKINDDCIVGALTMTAVDQELESGWIYTGRPAEKYKQLEIRDRDDLTPEQRASQNIFKQLIQEYDNEKVIDRSVMNAIKKAAKEEEKAEKLRLKAEMKMLQAEEKQKQYQAKARRYMRKAEKVDLEAQVSIGQAVKMIKKNRLKSDYYESEQQKD